ncbi:phytoene desaturase family protein [Sutcliffiella horikoshii]|uniref:phytoene desaturase family protein n=1 Tax=Sutcliffiella horikoshii TaxID=79883 RepID=UPI001EEF0AFC|nr:phytoene desaturase family protein [Sutcliffiella horikoshii]MCG1020062.1 phytoene desaturase [Sutcliffiella horikoshii]
MSRHIAVAGAGIGGMITALLLKKQGFNVSIYEKEKQAGGRLSFVEREGYRIDKGPTIVLLPEMLTSILQEAGVSDDAWELIRLDTLYSIHFKDGKKYSKFKDRDKQLLELSQEFPGEEEGFKQYMEAMKTNFEIGQTSFLEKSFTRKRDFWTGKNLTSLVRLKAYQSTKKFSGSFFKDERLREAYSLQTLYIGGHPQTSPAMYSLIPYSEHEHGIHYMKGGYASLVKVLTDTLKENEIPLYVDSRVEDIKKANGLVESIRVNGRAIEVDALVWNGDFPTAAHILHDKRKYEPSSGCVLFYFGLDGVYEESDIHQFFMGGDFDQHMREVFEEKKVPTDPSFYTFNPSLIDSSLAPDGKSTLYVLVPVPSGSHIDWSLETVFMEKMLKNIEERAFPGLSDKMEWMEVRTPNDAEQDGLFQGGSFGIAPSLFQSGVFRPQAKPTNLENVYATGASVHPGGGIPIVMQSAKLAANQIIQDFAHHSSTKDVNLNDRLNESLSSL